MRLLYCSNCEEYVSIQPSTDQTAKYCPFCRQQTLDQVGGWRRRAQ